MVAMLPRRSGIARSEDSNADRYCERFAWRLCLAGPQQRQLISGLFGGCLPTFLRLRLQYRWPTRRARARDRSSVRRVCIVALSNSPTPGPLAAPLAACVSRRPVCGHLRPIDGEGYNDTHRVGQEFCAPPSAATNGKKARGLKLKRVHKHTRSFRSSQPNC
jgi:hypothetical protein